MLRFLFDVLTFYLPPIEDNRRLKKPRSCILRDRSLLQLTEVSDAYRHFPITKVFTLMRTLPHKHRVCECFSLGLPFLNRLYSNVCHVL